MTTEKTFMPYHETDTPLDGGEEILSVSLPYASFYKLTYNYNTQTKMYERFINGSPHASQTGVTFGAKNLLVLYVKNYMLADTENKGRQDMDTVGTGNGYYLTDGKMVDITWSKKSRSEKSSYKTADGKEIVLNPGVTWIQIIDPSKTVTFE